MTRTVILISVICWRLPYCVNVVDFIPKMIFLHARQCSATSRFFKATQQFLRKNTRLHSCWWMNADDILLIINRLDYCFSDVLQELVYEIRRLPFADLQNLKKAIKNKWKEITIECRMSIAQSKKNDWMWLESRMEARFSTYFANRCDWISILCSKTCWTYGLYCTFRTPNTLLRISLLKQKRIMS